jgi:carbamoyltransferase
VRDRLNRRKGREGFRPFAPAVLAEDVGPWFDVGEEPLSPFMLRVVPVWASRRQDVPAIVHVDGTARLQTVTESSPLHPLLVAWRRATRCPMLLNTSFNRAGEPIVETFADAIVSALAMGLHALWLDDGRGTSRLVELTDARE